MEAEPRRADMASVAELASANVSQDEPKYSHSAAHSSGQRKNPVANSAEMPTASIPNRGKEHVGMSETQLRFGTCASVASKAHRGPHVRNHECHEWREVPHTSQPSEPRTPYEIAPHTIVFTPADLDAYVATKLEAELSPLRALVEKWFERAYAKDGSYAILEQAGINQCADELSAVLDRMGK